MDDLCRIALFSVALNARAGAFFILPMLVPWAGFHAGMTGPSIPRTLIGAVAAVGAGFAREYALVAWSGGTPGDAQSNFSYTLYGLAVGGKTWTAIFADHPEIGSITSDGARRERSTVLPSGISLPVRSCSCVRWPRMQ